MNDIDRMLIEHECCKLMLLYCRHTDHLAPMEFASSSRRTPTTIQRHILK